MGAGGTRGQEANAMQIEQGAGGCSPLRGRWNQQEELHDGGSPLRGDPPPPRHGESNPDPQRACSPGEPSWRVVQKLSAAQDGNSALPTPYKNSA